MKFKVLFLLCVLTTILFIQANTVYGQESKSDGSIGFINSKLSHSVIMKIDRNGLVTIKAPDQVITFDIKEAAFNYNSNNRIRVMCDYCIRYYDDGKFENTAHRQSFACKSRFDANEAIKAFKRLKALYLKEDEVWKRLDKKFGASDSSLKYKSVFEAIDFINENLDYSAILKVDENGIMFINGPDYIYRVDIEQAEFGLNNKRSSNPRIRVYGDWCIQAFDEDGKDQDMVRESFQAKSKNSARQSVEALYRIKSAYTGVDALKNVKETRALSYSNIQEAIDYINDRLAISIIMSIDSKGMATVNASEAIYKFDITACEFTEPSGKHNFWGFIKSIFSHDAIDSVEIRNRGGMKQYEKKDYEDVIDAERFLCESTHDVGDVIDAFNYIKNKLKAGK